MITAEQLRIMEINSMWFEAAKIVKQLALIENETIEDIARRIGILAEITLKAKEKEQLKKQLDLDFTNQ